MLPQFDPAHVQDVALRQQRRASAVQAMDGLTLWIADERPELRLPVGNLPRLWAALAMRDSLDEHVRLARLAGEAPRPQEKRDVQSWQDDQHRLTALERFHHHYKANLHAV